MKISIDASQLTQFGRTGTHVYLYNLIKALAQIDKSNEYTIYFKSAPAPSFVSEMFSSNPNFKYKVLPDFISWTHLSFATQMFLSQPDIILCPWHTAPRFLPLKSTLVTVFHGADEHSIEHEFFVRNAINRSHHIIAVSNFTSSGLQNKYKVLPEKISVIYEGVDTSTYHAYAPEVISDVKEKYELKNDYFFSLGTIEPRKNTENMIKGFSVFLNGLSAEEKYNYTYVIGGRMTNSCTYLLDLPKSLGIEGQVKFIGTVSVEDAPVLISGASVFAYVSQSEGFGLNVLEGMACGVPVISTTAGAVPEVADDAALLVDPQSIDAIAAGFKTLVQNPQVIEPLISKGFERIKEFNWRNTALETLSLFEKL